MKLHWLIVFIIACLGCTKDTTPKERASEDDSAADVQVELPGEASDDTDESQSQTLGDARDAVVVETDAESIQVDQPPELLKVGDVAPGISLDQWALGEPVVTLNKGELYVIEFWATWCGPCLVSMPHLSELQEKYDNQITVIGVSDEDEETVTAFLEKPSIQDPSKTWSDVIKYRLAFDPDGSTHVAFMEASGTRGIPTAYVVSRQGKLLWTGSPMHMDEPLQEIVSGEWNDDNAVAKAKEFEAVLESLDNELRKSMMAQRNEEWEEALAILTAIENDETLGRLAGDLSSARLGLLMAAKRTDQTLQLARELEIDRWNDSNRLHGLAWRLATGFPEEAAVLELALKYANRVNELTGGEDHSVFDTLARVYYEQGNLDSAISWQQKAVDLAEGRWSEKYQETLDEYLIERAKQNDTSDVESPDGDVDEKEASDQDVSAAT